MKKLVEWAWNVDHAGIFEQLQRYIFFYKKKYSFCFFKWQIRKSTSEEKRNVKKVAELLSIPMDETLRNSSMEPIRISSSPVNQMRNEKDEMAQLHSLSPRNKNRGQPILQNQSKRCAEDQMNHQVRENFFLWEKREGNLLLYWKSQIVVRNARCWLHDRGTTKTTNSPKFNDSAGNVKVYQDDKIAYVLLEIRRKNQFLVEHGYRRSLLPANRNKIHGNEYPGERFRREKQRNELSGRW